MKKVILYGLGNNGKNMIKAYYKYECNFQIVAVTDSYVNEGVYENIPIITPKMICGCLYDEIWIASIYYQEIEKNLVEEFNISMDIIRYIEYPMPILEEIIFKKYKKELLDIEKCNSKDLKQVIRYIKDNGVRMYCYPFYEEYKNKKVPLFYDDKNEVYYTEYLGKRMYLSRAFDTVEKAKIYVKYTFMEQDQRSPHCYLTKKFNVADKTIGIDIGAAEGIFALSVIDRVEHIYLIESDQAWCEALKLTFEPYREKVTILNGYVSNQKNTYNIVLDDYFQNKRIDFIKIDIEGAEICALQGAEKLIYASIPDLAVCTYHHAEDYKKISEFIDKFAKYTIEHSDGYVVCQGEWELNNLNQVDFRRAILWAGRKNEKISSMYT